MSEQVAKRVVIDIDRCIECGSCGAACYYSHAGMPIVQSAKTGPALLPVICRQCKSPSCVDACPANAMLRDELGVVRRALFRCVGCGSCARGCPFGVLPNEVERRQIPKCDLCEDRTATGQSVPRCVAACPSGALIYADEREAVAAKLLTIGGRSAGENPFKRR
jgi:Fe-S-cluster-containing dehydrogenase component